MYVCVCVCVWLSVCACMCMCVMLGCDQSLLHDRSLESAAGKIIKGLAWVFLEHLVLNQNVSSVSSVQIAGIPECLCLLHECSKHNTHHCLQSIKKPCRKTA